MRGGYRMNDDSVQQAVDVAFNSKGTYSEAVTEGFIHLLNSISKENKPSTQNSCVYVIETDGGLVKVGVSMTPNERIKTLENLGGYVAIRKYISEPCKCAIKIENQVHKTLYLYRKKSEYFTCPFEMAKNAVISCFEDIVLGVLE